LVCSNRSFCHGRMKNAALWDIWAWSGTGNIWIASMYLRNTKQTSTKVDWAIDFCQNPFEGTL
jgi:hypothetical protein